MAVERGGESRSGWEVGMSWLGKGCGDRSVGSRDGDTTGSWAERNKAYSAVQQFGDLPFFSFHNLNVNLRYAGHPPFMFQDGYTRGVNTVRFQVGLHLHAARTR